MMYIYIFEYMQICFWLLTCCSFIVQFLPFWFSDPPAAVDYSWRRPALGHICLTISSSKIDARQFPQFINKWKHFVRNKIVTRNLMLGVLHVTCLMSTWCIRSKSMHLYQVIKELWTSHKALRVWMCSMCLRSEGLDCHKPTNEMRARGRCRKRHNRRYQF